MADAQPWFLRIAGRLSYPDFEAEVRQWELKGSFGAGQGASIDDIFRRYISAERLADWEKAKAEHGNAACAADLPRTEAQRRADALWQIFQDAAGADGSAVGVEFVHHIIWNETTFEEMLRRLSGEKPTSVEPDSSSAPHSIGHTNGGRTNPGNRGPFCGKHNRHKQKGFSVWRDPTGAWHT